MLLPVDSYIVINKNIITDIDKKVLIDLYQPIIGSKAVNLYYTLLNDLSKNEIITDTYYHHHLLSSMLISIEELIDSRSRLEAVGLIKTYLKKGDVNNYVYVLYSPLSSYDFLNHPILNIVLYNNIGKKEYKNIVEYYKVPKINLKDYENITNSFDEVFKSIPKDLYLSNEDLVNKEYGKLNFKNNIDFTLLISGLNTSVISEKAFTQEIKELINNLSYIYDIDIDTMKNIINTCINEKGTIDKEILRKSSRNYYSFENKGSLPTLVSIKDKNSIKINNDSSNRDKMIYTFENTNPLHFLQSKYKDGKPLTRDINLIESLLIDLRLNPGVVNVLIDYVLRVNNQKLSKSYVETIAGHWKRLGINTVESAMKECIKEHKNKYKNDKSKINKEVVPEWFNQKVEKKVTSKEEEEKLKELLGD